MAYLLTNQNNFAHIAYPSPSAPKATVASGGCGPCAALMIVENMTEYRYKMAEWIAWVISTGARVSGGTNMAVLAKAMAAKFGFTVNISNSEDELLRQMKSGGMAIANVGGASGSWKGLFSTSGHFITILGSGSDGRLVVGDPDDRSGKYSSGSLGCWRAQYVTVRDGLIYVKREYLHQDTLQRDPNYYLFALPAAEAMEREDEEMVRYKTVADVPDWGVKTVEKLLSKGLLLGTDSSGTIDISEDMLRMMVIHDRAGIYD